MACKTCGRGIASRLAGMVAGIENKFSGANQNQNLGPVPTQQVSGPDSNVYGNPASRISGNGTNLSFQSRN